MVQGIGICNLYVVLLSGLPHNKIAGKLQVTDGSVIPNAALKLKYYYSDAHEKWN